MDQRIIDDGWYTATELVNELTAVKGSPVGISTVRAWRTRIGMTPTRGNLFSTEDLTILASLVLWRQAGRSINSFIEELYASQSTDENEPITVEAQVI